jgi:FtsH-binding integral membrane protein
MATIALQVAPAELREKRFFLVMAVAIAATVVVGFSLFYAAGISSFDSPWWVHVHAVTFVGWIVLYVLQNTLVFRDDLVLHRKLGRIGAGYAVWVVVVGLVLTPLTLAVGRSPPFFTAPYFLALDWVNIAVFGALVYAAVRNRRRTDWHRRLMLCATICVIAPAVGRLIVLSGNTMTAPVNVAFLLPFVVAGMLFDWRNRGRVHPAYAWGAAALLVFAAATELLARWPFFAGQAALIAG